MTLVTPSHFIDVETEKKHIYGKQVHEKVLNITNHQGNSNQNHNEISPHTYQNGNYQKDKKYQVLTRM